MDVRKATGAFKNFYPIGFHLSVTPMETAPPPPQFFLVPRLPPQILILREYVLRYFVHRHIDRKTEEQRGIAITPWQGLITCEKTGNEVADRQFHTLTELGGGAGKHIHTSETLT